MVLGTRSLSNGSVIKSGPCEEQGRLLYFSQRPSTDRPTRSCAATAPQLLAQRNYCLFERPLSQVDERAPSPRRPILTPGSPRYSTTRTTPLSLSRRMPGGHGSVMTSSAASLVGRGRVGLDVLKTPDENSGAGQRSLSTGSGRKAVGGRMRVSFDEDCKKPPPTSLASLVRTPGSPSETSQRHRCSQDQAGRSRPRTPRASQRVSGVVQAELQKIGPTEELAFADST
eukprot:TRINITY_DN65968_c0_g1_i1.p1 TRINITY_DN65968_c0_g1~~TRINITY_DN65968_c0_g1_i1.p1  ORF type:complete len:228 (+),score=12.51 TRINITY_DN65968_c0_g1_i1:123-806(+)